MISDILMATLILLVIIPVFNFWFFRKTTVGITLAIIFSTLKSTIHLIYVTIKFIKSEIDSFAKHLEDRAAKKDTSELEHENKKIVKLANYKK